MSDLTKLYCALAARPAVLCASLCERCADDVIARLRDNYDAAFNRGLKAGNEQSIAQQKAIIEDQSEITRLRERVAELEGALKEARKHFLDCEEDIVTLMDAAIRAGEKP